MSSSQFTMTEEDRKRLQEAASEYLGDLRIVTITYNNAVHHIRVAPHLNPHDVENILTRTQIALSFEHYNDADDMEFIHCLVGNVVDKHVAGPQLGIKHGTKQFSAGTKVYCFPARWGDGYENILVLGKPRKRKKLIKVIMKSKFIKNWRLKKVYDPFIITEMTNNFGWTNSADDEATIECMLEWLPGITVEELPSNKNAQD